MRVKIPVSYYIKGAGALKNCWFHAERSLKTIEIRQDWIVEAAVVQLRESKICMNTEYK